MRVLRVPPCFHIAIILLLTTGTLAQAPIEYRLSFADAVHHVMQVEVTFRNVPPAPLQVRMSRSSPGRYAAFNFAKNLFEEHFTDGDGQPLTPSRPNPHEWDVTGHNGTVHISYKIFGNRADGTFLAVDTTHAHLNFPATLMWARGLTNRPARLAFVQPVGSDWKVATQLYPTSDPLTFTAPNLQYLMDSPTEFSNFALRTFTVPARDPGGKTQTLRVAIHHLGTDAELDAYVAGLEKIVREEQAVFGELPDFDPGYYVFLADYLPWDDSDGMEHRNSTVVSGRATLAKDRVRMLGTAAHEFFHCWNVKRIRPATLEPFNFEDANISGELWLAEGFTNYYGHLTMLRSGIDEDPIASVSRWMYSINGLLFSPGTAFRPAVAMSRLAPFVDGAATSDPTYWANTEYSYYPFGDVIALGLDLTLRARSDSRVTLDDFMRAMWRAHGRPGGPAPGLVGKPYTLADVRARLAEVSGDKGFADDFVRRYIEGTERVDYAPLLLRAGFVLRKQNAGKPTLGLVRLEKKDSVLRVTGPTLTGSPAYNAGLDLDDELISVAGTTMTSPDDLSKAIADHKPRDEVDLVFKRRGQEVHAKAQLVEDPNLEIVSVEKTGGTLTNEQKRFRDAWLKSKAAVQEAAASLFPHLAAISTARTPAP
jgi:predicted metalloprotease with PDZ domain